MESFKEIYYSKKSNKYYYLGIMPCEKCRNFIEKILFLETTYTKSKKSQRFFCKDCITKRQKVPSIYSSIFTCIVCDNLPKDAFPVFDSPPVLSNFSGQDIVMMSSKNVDGERVVDKTFQSHNKHFMSIPGSKNANDVLEDIKIKDKKYMLKNIDFVFRNEKKSLLLTNRFEDEKENKRLSN